MKMPYGYIRGTRGMDGDEVDVFVGPMVDAKFAYVIMIKRQPEFVKDDEEKVLLGFPSRKVARDMFDKHYDDSRFFGRMRAIPMEDFKKAVGQPGKIAAGGAGSGCQGPNCGRPRQSGKLLQGWHNRQLGRHVTKVLSKEFPDIKFKVVGSVAEKGVSRNDLDVAVRWKSYVEDPGFDDKSFNHLSKVMKDIGFVLDNIPDHGFLWANDTKRLYVDMWFVEPSERERKFGDMEADAGEPQVYPGGYAHMEPRPSFHPPSLRNPKRVPVDDPVETDDSFGDVSKRKERGTRGLKNRLGGRPGSDAKYLGIRTTQVSGFPSGTVGGFG